MIKRSLPSFDIALKSPRRFALPPQSLIEVFDAAQLTINLNAPDFPKRGGIMVVGPPGALKTSLLLRAFSHYPSSLILSDLNVNSMMSLREELISNRFTSMIFPEFEKLYQRRADTASNIEGTIKQLVEDGFMRASFEPQAMVAITARALVCGAITYNFYANHFQAWKDSGFVRRFLWVHIRLRQPDLIMQAVHDWKLIEIDGIMRKSSTSAIPFDVTTEESKFLWEIITPQGEATPFVLLKKIFAVLKWKHGPKDALQIISDFALCLRGQGLIDLKLKNGAKRT